MIALDTSSFAAYLSGGAGPDVDLVDQCLETRRAVLPPVVLAELLSEPTLKESVAEALLEMPTLAVVDGYWERTGRLRAKVLAAGRRSRLADALIAQSCMDHQVPLVARDHDFAAFEAAGLRLVSVG